MRRFVFLFLSIMSVAVSAKAQTFTQHLQQNQAGKGKVSISQSREIDALVNGTITRQSVPVAEAQKQTIKKNISTTAKTPTVPQKTTALRKLARVSRKRNSKHKRPSGMPWTRPWRCKDA